MRLVDREETRAGAPDERERTGLREPLGRYVEEAQRTCVQPLDGLAACRMVVRRIEGRGRDSTAPKLRHLVMHQRDEGRDHDGEALTQEGRQLIAQRLAAAGRHDGEHVLAVQHGAHDLFLAGPEGAEAEDGMEESGGVREGVAHLRRQCRAACPPSSVMTTPLM